MKRLCLVMVCAFGSTTLANAQTNLKVVEGGVVEELAPSLKLLDQRLLDSIKTAPRYRQVVPVHWSGEVYCEANFDERCKATFRFEAPAGWQACKPLGSVTSNIGGGYSWTPISFYTNDPESPDRFRGYQLYITAAGSGNPLDQTGGNIRVRPVGLYVIEAEATNEERYIAGCEMPRHD